MIVVAAEKVNCFNIKNLEKFNLKIINNSRLLCELLMVSAIAKVKLSRGYESVAVMLFKQLNKTTCHLYRFLLLLIANLMLQINLSICNYG